MGYVGEIDVGLIELSLQFMVVGLFVAQGILDFIDDLVCALQLLEGVLVG